MSNLKREHLKKDKSDNNDYGKEESEKGQF